jgi:hypothetical protein
MTNRPAAVGRPAPEGSGQVRTELREQVEIPLPGDEGDRLVAAGVDGEHDAPDLRGDRPVAARDVEPFAACDLWVNDRSGAYSTKTGPPSTVEIDLAFAGFDQVIVSLCSTW